MFQYIPVLYYIRSLVMVKGISLVAYLLSDTP